MMSKFFKKALRVLVERCWRVKFIKKQAIKFIDTYKYLLNEKYILVNKGEEGIIREDSFHPYSLTNHEIVDKSKQLIIEKGMFRLSLRNQSHINHKEVPGMMIVDNKCQSYDKFWEDDKMLGLYLEPGRLNFYKQVFNICSEYITGKLIDIGCGSGDFLKIISESGANCEIYGLDFSSGSIQRCKEIIPNGIFFIKDIYHLELEDNVFDTVVCMEVLEHLERPDVAFTEMTRICKNDGTIIVTIPNGDLDSYVGHINFWSDIEFKNFIGNLDLLNFYYLEDKKSMLFIIKKAHSIKLSY